MDVSTKVSRDVHHVFASYFKGSEAVAYALSRALAEGSLCLDIEEYKAEMHTNATTVDENPFWTDCTSFDSQLKNELWVTTDPAVLKPFVMVNENIYLQRYFEYETRIINNIKRLKSNFRIITGGPGTGKTFGVADELGKLLAVDPSLKVAMAAPTGKAAARMEESIRKFVNVNTALEVPIQNILKSLKATTIHSLLGYIHNSVYFRHNDKNKLPYDVVVIDEASMVDGAMMAKLLDAIDMKTMLFLIGDKNQLASVEAGSVFGDICMAEESVLLNGKVETKKRNFRSTDNILNISKSIIEGSIDFENWINQEARYDATLKKSIDGITINNDPNMDEKLFRDYASIYMEYIQEKDNAKALKKLNSVRFLCATRSHDNSVAETNARIEKILDEMCREKEMHSFKPRKGSLYHNQPIIITKNDNELGLSNGDVGIVRKNDDDTLIAYFEGEDGQVIEKKAGYLNHYETAFAMTIHKSQGSEFDNVVVLLPRERGEKLLTRELLYTAVTRAKHNVLIQADSEVLQKCVARSVSRASGLTQRIKS
jgi:exodeoxyribonuclease V alpha subunit